MTDGIDQMRRRVLQGGAALLAAGPVAGLAQAAAADETVPLWSDAYPAERHRPGSPQTEPRTRDGGLPDRWIRGINEPALIVRRAARPNGAAVLLVPGGGYGFLAYDNEGTEQAAWLNARGITAFILLYRLPGEKWTSRERVPLQDAQRAMRLIRSQAARFAVDPARIAVLGFSAGGHLAGSLATRADERVYDPVDAADRLSARPDLAGLIYPVISMEAGVTHGGSRDALLGPNPSAALIRATSVETRVTAATPPVFLTHAGDDGAVPVANSLRMYAAMLAAKRPAELHVFDEGGHGFGTRLPKTVPTSAWPELFHAYGVRKGVFAG